MNLIRGKKLYDYDRAVKMLNLLTFLSLENNTELEHSFLLPSNINLITIHYKEEYLKNIMINLAIAVMSKEKENPNEFKECRFDLIYEKLKANEFLIIDKLDDELLLYIADSLENYQNLPDLKMRIVSLVSLLVLLLAHNPDSSRFNIDDSIRKQFANKILIILHINKEIKNWKEQEKLLLLIYDLRSSIAHGSFDKIKVICKKITNWRLKNDDIYPYNGENCNETETLFYINYLLRKYLRIILKHYLKDKTLFEILK